jgi:hypothetical protein
MPPTVTVSAHCFFIWAAGVERQADVLGLHRPTIQSTSFANSPPDCAATQYRQLLIEIGAYLRDMEIPRRFIDMMIGEGLTMADI